MKKTFVVRIRCLDQTEAEALIKYVRTGAGYTEEDYNWEVDNDIVEEWE